jgi:hypothetical protein
MGHCPELKFKVAEEMLSPDETPRGQDTKRKTNSPCKTKQSKALQNAGSQKPMHQQRNRYSPNEQPDNGKCGQCGEDV